MSKYDEIVVQILKKDEIQSTNQVLKELEKRSKKAINWHALYRILNELAESGKVEKLKAQAGFFWKRK